MSGKGADCRQICKEKRKERGYGMERFPEGTKIERNLEDERKQDKGSRKV